MSDYHIPYSFSFPPYLLSLHPLAPFFIPVSSLLHMYTVIHLHVYKYISALERKHSMSVFSLTVINFNDYVRFCPFLYRGHNFFLMLFSDWPISCQA